MFNPELFGRDCVIIIFQAALLVPSWFQTDQMVMLTLNPPV